MTYPFVNFIRTVADATSTNLATLSEAVNARIRSGIGNGAYRIAQLWFNLFRQFRMPSAPDEFGVQTWPRQGEALDKYGPIPWPFGAPGNEWPGILAGAYEGANLANPLAQFMYGNPITFGDPGALASEATRLNALAVATDGDSPSVKWTQGGQQRGTTTADLSTQNVPFFVASQSFMRVVMPPWSPMGKAYGGYQAMPGVGDPAECTDPTSGNDAGPNYQYKFSALRSGVSTAGLHGSIDGDPPVVTYPGRCPGTDGNVAYIARMPFYYYVWTYNGASYDVDAFPTRDWIEGPYTGVPALQREDGGMIERALWAYMVGFRGTVDERTPDTFDIRKICTAFQKLSTMQWPLAPNRGHVSGSTMVSDYPTFTTAALSGPGPWAATGAIPNATYGDSGASPHTLAVTDGKPWVVSGWFASATKLASPVTVQLLNQSGTVIAGMTLTPDDTGLASKLKWFRSDLSPAPTSISVQIVGTASFTDATGQLSVETTELYPYQPDWWDIQTAIRLATATGEATQKRGLDWADSLALSTSILENGCVIQSAALADDLDVVNDSAVYDAARSLAMAHTRFVTRDQFSSYEVTGGFSILKLKRYVLVDGNYYDQFDGIAPAGTDTEGIVRVAPEKGWTNEWCMFLQTHVYKDDEASIWKPLAYGDYFTWNNRCLFQCGYPAVNALNPFVNYNAGNATDGSLGGQANFVSPESVDAYTYAEGINAVGSYTPPADFYSACRIYEPPPELDSVTLEETGNSQLVVLKFRLPTATVGTYATRLRSHPTAPSSWTVADGPGTSLGSADLMDPTYGGTELYRTDDNALREYALWVGTARNACQRLGDNGLDSESRNTPPSPTDTNGFWGSVLPHFIFVKLIPKPWEDANDTQNSTDSRVTIDAWQQIELYLRAMVEGFIDPASTYTINNCTLSEGGCAHGDSGLYDFTWESACYSAGQDIAAAHTADSTIPADLPFRYIGAFNSTFRSDGPPGHGPLPGVQASVSFVQLFNRAAAVVNQMTRARVILPASLKTNTFVANRAFIPIDLTAAYPTGAWPASCGQALSTGACSTTYAAAAQIDAPPSVGAPSSPDGWIDAGAIVAVDSWGLESATDTPTCCPSPPAAAPGTQFYDFHSTTTTQFQWALTDANALAAIPENWQALTLDTDSGFLKMGSLFCRQSLTTYVSTSATPDSGSDTVNALPVVGTGCQFYQHVTTAADCFLATAGTATITAPVSALSCAFYDAGTGIGTPYGPSASATYYPIAGSTGGAMFVEVPFPP